VDRAEQRAARASLRLERVGASDAPPPEEDLHAATLGLWSRASIRAVDLVISIVALIVFAPFLLCTALAIRLTSPGPALFRQTRVGLHGQPFVMLKFRTMQVDNDDAAHRAFVLTQMSGEARSSERSGPHKLEEDPRVTRLGGHLRRLSIDELPQLINVVLGQMSLVGPRPALSWEVKLYQPWHYIRLEAKPGITGLWQVSGRSYVSMLDALTLDADYVANKSLGLDLAIILKTIPKVLSRHGAY
jgi:lipopolysaccharide/colanic/teichoic acid biosynthesis glycosyltransferase